MKNKIDIISKIIDKIPANKEITEYIYFKFKKMYLEKYSPDIPFCGNFNEICEKYGHTIKFAYGLHESIKNGFCPRCGKMFCTMNTKDSYTDPEFTDLKHPLERIQELKDKIKDK